MEEMQQIIKKQGIRNIDTLHKLLESDFANYVYDAIESGIGDNGIIYYPFTEQELEIVKTIKYKAMENVVRKSKKQNLSLEESLKMYKNTVDFLLKKKFPNMNSVFYEYETYVVEDFISNIEERFPTRRMEISSLKLIREFQQYGLRRESIALSGTLNVNLYLSFGLEEKSHFKNIANMASCLTGYGLDETCETLNERRVGKKYHTMFNNNMLSWLLSQQGHTFEELIQPTENRFIASMQDQINSIDGDYNQMVICVKLSPEQALALECNFDKNIYISKNAGSIGLVNPYPDKEGLGSFRIELENDLVISPHMIKKIQYESGKSTSKNILISERFENQIENAPYWGHNGLNFTKEEVQDELHVDLTHLIETMDEVYCTHNTFYERYQY